MFRHLRQWFIKLWRRFLGLFRKPQPINPPAPQLIDADYEKLFFQLLSVVNSGMGEREVLRCLESLKQRSYEAEWVQWLGRFGDRLLASDAPNRELAEKMVKLGEVNGGQLTEIAGNIGRELLSRCGEKGPVTLDISRDAIAFFNQGVEQDHAGDLNGALASFEKAIKIEPKFHYAWNGKGIIMKNLGRYDEALASFKEAIEIEPKFHYAWYNKGIIMRDLERYEEALANFEEAIKIEPKYHNAWNEKGNLLKNLERYEEALASYDRAIKIEPKYHDAWNHKGAVLCDYFGRYSEAIDAFNHALQLTNNQDWLAWLNRGVAISYSQGYDAAIENWDEGLENIPPKELEGRAKLHQHKGDVHYDYARFQLDRYPYLNKARNSYIDALKTLSKCQNDILGEILSQPCPPQLLPLYLKILQELAKVCKALGNQKDFEHCLNIGDHLLEELLKSQSNEQKIILSRKYASFNQLRVLLYAQSPEPEKQKQALKLSQQRKNLCLRWMQQGWVEMETPELTIPPGVALLDWHYSDAGIVVFILRNDRPLKVCILTSQIPQILDNSADKVVGEFEEWMKQWQENYEKQRGKKEEQTQSREWQKSIIPELEKLRKILQIDEQILPNLTAINHLILIPHRHLHLLPLEYFFHTQQFTISRLPSLQMGIDLENSPTLEPRQILNIENPTNDLAYATIESAAIKRLFPHQTLKGNEATKKQILDQLNNENYNIFHFTGHAQHEFNQPLNSYLTLAENDKLTLKDIFKLNLTHHHLICLSACETGLTTKDNLIDEFVGLASGFLSAGIPYIISTLWRVNEYSNMLLIVNFYQRLQDTPNIHPSLALQKAKNWLRTLTPNDEIQWYKKLAEDFKESPKFHLVLTLKIDSLKQEYATIEPTKPLYDHPYHWAGFIITGNYP